MPVPIAALYLAVFAVFGSVLAFFPGRIRGSAGISVGDGGRIYVPKDVPRRVPGILADRDVRDTDVEVLSSEERRDLGTIAGHGEAEVEWVVRAPAGASIRVEAWHPKAGRALAEVEASGPADLP